MVGHGAAAEVLDEFGIPYEADVVSAHRMPEDMIEYGKKAHSRGIRVIIAGAGGAAHLPGMLASVTALPVIGVPVRLKNLEGMDSLLSIVQMPAGVPVATVSINGARNAGLLALRILGSGTDAFAQQVHADLRQSLRICARPQWTGSRSAHPSCRGEGKAAAERERRRAPPRPAPFLHPKLRRSPRLTFPKLGYTRRMSNILQSDIWARFQESNGHTVIRKSGNGWSYLATVEGGATGRYLYSPYGPVASSAVAFDEALTSLKEEAGEARCLFVRIEPTESAIWGDQDAAAFLARRGAVLAPRQVQPSHTQIIDLSGSEDEILKGMKSNNRNLHRNIHKKGVTIEVSTNPEDLSILFAFLDETADRNGFNRQQDEYLMQVARVLMPAGAASLYIAKLTDENGESTPIAAAFVYDSDDTRTYAHAAASFEHRRLSAGIPVVTNFILDAKRKGLKYVDLFGIAPEDQPDHEWAGFTKFKKSFGGESVEYRVPGMFR